MTVADIFTAARKRLDDAYSSGTPASDFIYWSEAEAYCALNEAQEQFALLTLCLESTGTLPLAAAKCFYQIRGYLAGYLLALRVSVGGVKLQPTRLADADARYFAWAATTGTPSKYLALGMTMLAIVPQPTGSTSADIVFAREPSVLSTSGQTPEIPAEYHPALTKYMVYWLLQKRGGQYLELAVGEWKKFLADAAQCADYVRRRNRARQYDRFPAEIRIPAQKEGPVTANA